MTPISVGIAGLGRSGWSIHAAALATLPEHYKVAAVMDFDEGRRQEAAAKFGCNTYSTYAELLADPAVELVIVATPNRFHTPNTIEALEAGKHVVCEKPFGISSEEAGQMIEAAAKAGKVLAPFQNRRFEALFQKVKEIVESGILGEIQIIKSSWHGFGRRWDWQTLNEFDGGQLLNNGPHAVDQALQLFGEQEYELLADLRNVLTSGDAEDQIKIVLRPTGKETGKRGPILDLEMSSSAGFPQDRWIINGDAGSLRAYGNKVEWKWVNWDNHPRKEVERVPTPDRSYNSEKIEWQSAEWQEPTDGPGLSDIFYNNLYEVLREGKTQNVSPQSVQRVMKLIEDVKAKAPVQQGRFSLQNNS